MCPCSTSCLISLFRPNVICSGVNRFVDRAWSLVAKEYPYFDVAGHSLWPEVKDWQQITWCF